MSQGVAAYKSARYDEAIAAFERASSMQPESLDAHLYLGTALLSQWIPGGVSPENEQLARRAQSEFEAVARADPQNHVAHASLASLAFNEAGSKQDPAERSRKFDEAADFNMRLIRSEPRNKEAHYSLGVIAWSKFYPAFGAARAKVGMRPEDPGPLRDFNARVDLRVHYATVVEDGIRHLQSALQIDAAYDDAMAYMNLLIRERADWRDTIAEYKQDVVEADAWVQKALDTKKAKAAMFAGPPEGPQQIQVGSVQAANLVTKVDPVYPALARQARIQGTVRLTATIDREGRVADLQLVSWHPLLVPAAIEAVRQWAYRPTLLNGQPVDVVTVIDVPFSLAQ